MVLADNVPLAEELLMTFCAPRNIVDYSSQNGGNRLEINEDMWHSP